MSMTLTHDMAEAWRSYMRSGNTFSDFLADYDDPEENWKKGNSIRVGLRLVDGTPHYFAHNLSEDREIHYTILNKEVGGGFWKNFNPYRRLRPRPPEKRKAGALDAPSKDTAQCGFKCDDPKHPWSLLARDPVSVLLMPNSYWASYYNFSPFEEGGHFLWLPVRIRGNVLVLPHMLQCITRDFLSDGIRLFTANDGMLLFFNSLHAGASQNHFHYQAVSTRGREFAIVQTRPPDGGYVPLINYPVRGLAISANCPIDTIYGFIQRLDTKGMPFNLVMVERAIYLIPRRAEHELVDEFPYGVLGSMEMAGRLILSDPANFRETDYTRVHSALGKISISEAQFLDVFDI